MKRIAMLLTVLFLLSVAAPSFAGETPQWKKKLHKNMKYRDFNPKKHMENRTNKYRKSSNHKRQKRVKDRYGHKNDVVDKRTKWERRQQEIKEFNARMIKENEERQRLYEKQKQEVKKYNEEVRKYNEKIRQYKDDQARQKAHEINEKYRFDQQYRRRTGGSSRDSGGYSNWKPYSGQVDPNRPYTYHDH